MNSKQKNTQITLFFGKLAAFLLALTAAYFIFANFAQAADAVPVFRFHSPKYKSHYYTISEKERDKVINNWPEEIWKYESVDFYAYASGEDGLIPVYRFWSRKYKAFYYTKSAAEKNKIIANWPEDIWKYSGIAFYVSNSGGENLTPVYRFWSKKYKATYFTTSPGQKDCMIISYPEETWKYTGIIWYVPEEGAKLSQEVDYCGGDLGPLISVGLWSYSRSSLKDNPFRIDANRNYRIKDKNGKTIATVSASTETKVKYAGDGTLKVYNSIPERIVSGEVTFEEASGRNNSIIFDTHRPSSSFDEYRGKIKLRYSSESKNIWVINILPLEHYAWGNGEITGTGDMNYNRVMATVYRTYGKWKILYSTKYASEGFKVISTSANQIYRGYDWEKDHSRIKRAAQETRGRIVEYKGKTALSPYSSWTDGRTRSFQERWGSKDYPWCQSVKDPYGKHPTKSTSQLEAEGNHMVGLSAHGALELATDYSRGWTKIIKYYLTGVEIPERY